MLQKLFTQFKVFSRENWWVYAIFIIALGIVISTGKGNIWEIIFLFILNILGNICFILMLDSNNENDFSLGAQYFALGNVFFITLTLYGFAINGELQYLLWQFSFVLGGIKNIVRYCFKKEIFFINVYSLSILALGIIMFAVYINLSFYSILQSLGFAGVTVGLVCRSDISRFFMMFLGTFFISVGSFYGLWVNYLQGELLGITLSYGLLTLATFIFYLKILPNYISRLKIL